MWNLSVETQAISSAYKLGQDEIMYSYHLVTSGEEEKYCRQARKERLSELVFYSADNAGNEKKNSSDILDDSKDRGLEALVEQESLKCMFKRIIYEPEDSSLVKCIWFDRSIKSFLLIFC
ncbi:SNF2 DOMAIN-CONTAINING PROTEIN CLASSY 4 [Salix purpurea]|uniref:SNF2 DOMAIN-CONTAINING PROTEIN CLASSY 4 n=1 Tax=Salix purpurea TaxID=77065 RepID=A0A9Q0YVV1_SALPP|nr:SNF2 DOMAIN-CONTAINING PROTEIN CLASSY 4 [Salix purpurea]